MAVTALVSAASVVGGLFSSSGPDAKKWAERTAQVAALKSLAAQGNVNAWQALGAIGSVAPAPAGGLTVPGIESYKGGWVALGNWGDAYKPIIRDAAAAYNAFAPQFALSGVAQSVAQGQTIVQTLGSGGNPVLLPANGGAGSAAGPSSGLMGMLSGAIAGIPTWLLIVAALLLLFMLRK